MTPERFQTIVEAYGTASRRWPAAERAAAEAFLQNNAAARDLLSCEASLDRLLDGYRVDPPDSAVTGTIVGSFPSSRLLSWGSLLKGLGLVGAGLAGAIAGAFLMMVYAPPAATIVDDDERPIFTSFDISVSDFDQGETQ